MPKIHIREQTKNKLMKLMEKECKKKIDSGLIEDLMKKGVSFDFIISKLLDEKVTK